MSIVAEHFTSFGINVGDSVNPESDDAHSGRIDIPYNVTFFGTKYDHFYVSIIYTVSFYTISLSSQSFRIIMQYLPLIFDRAFLFSA